MVNASLNALTNLASHNANLVVNGDADLIAAFDYKVAGEQTAGAVANEGAIDDPAVRDAVLRAWMEAEAYRLATLADVTGLVKGVSQGARSSLTKIYWSELDVNLNETALRLLGPAAELIENSPDAVDGGAWMKGFEFALSGPIYAGTNEIQRNVVAERVLGLPRK